ncbi:MAG: hypothetical protein Unbinned5081contig1002_9 [Prokaryotic dsDNA virus sp.]|nr:MAG: hypothetical protein Unbinned5081contig1002_9 [Prokaryotic dsDNA virus sp.]|tara:strand:+ start:5035 stop:5370 length:336 start_codon:yes stop_codon:yes gene_type:complete
MTKLYYADPLSAAYMAREFGVKMYIEGSNVELNSWNDFFVEYGGGTIDAFSDEFYVHPDSYHIFEPQVGDVFEDANHRILKKHKHTIAVIHPITIIQRNNRPFFWPESEEV